MTILKRSIIALSLVIVFGYQQVDAYPLTLEQRERLKRFLPRTFTKLEAREPVYVAAVGDGVMSGVTPVADDKDNGNPLVSYIGKSLAFAAREFFYPGSVRIVNPAKDATNKLEVYLGDEILLENLCEPGATIFEGLQRFTTDAFLHSPDLIFIQFGTFDSLSDVPLDSYKRALQEMIDIGKQASTDMIVLGPPMVNFGGGAMEWGLDRPYAMAAKQVADANRVMFIDLGDYIARYGGGIDPDTEALAAMEIIGDKMKQSINHGPELGTTDRIHLNRKADDYLGEMLFREILDGPDPGDFLFTGAAVYAEKGQIRVAVLVRNQSADTKEGSIGALAVGAGLVPVQAAQRFEIPAGESKRMEFTYDRPVVGKSREGEEIYFPLPLNDEATRFSFVVEDTFISRLVNLPLRVGPVSVLWKTRQSVNTTENLRLDWILQNGTDKAISGKYQIGMGGSVGNPTNFSLAPLGQKDFFASFGFSPLGELMQFQERLWIDVEVDGGQMRFEREMEATKDIVLGETMSMKAWLEYANAAPAGTASAVKRQSGSATIRFDADAEALYLIADIDGVTIPNLGDRAALKAEVTIDARPINEVRTFGEVEPFEVYTRGTDSPGFTPKLPLGLFGNGYDMILQPKGITSALSTVDGKRRLEVRVPRSYLHRHEWDLETGNSLLGVRVELFVADSDANSANPFSREKCFVTHSPSYAYDNRAIRKVFSRDARSLTTLRLSRQPVNSWSVRIY